MKMSDLREKTKSELQDQLHELLSELFTYRAQQATSSLKQTHLLKNCKKDIARIKTLLIQNEGAGE